MGAKTPAVGVGSSVGGMRYTQGMRYRCAVGPHELRLGLSEGWRCPRFDEFERVPAMRTDYILTYKILRPLATFYGSTALGHKVPFVSSGKVRASLSP